MTFVLSTTLTRSYDDTVADVRDALSEQGFGILTEIDLKETLKKKLDVDVPAQVILGACRPQLAHRALEINPSVAAVLPCNVVVRSLDESTTVVEAFDPDAMTQLAGDDLCDVSAEAKKLLQAALDSLGGDR